MTELDQPLTPIGAREFAECIVDTIREPLVVLGADLRVRSANRSFYRTFAVTPEQTEGRLIYELGEGQWDIPQLRTLLDEILPRQNSFRDFEVDHTFATLGRKRMLLNARKLWREGNHTGLILLAIEDITGRWQAEVALHESRERYRLIVESATGYAIFTTDLEGVLTTWNPGAEKIFGYLGAEFIGKDFRIIYTPEDRAAGQAEVEMRMAEAEGRALDERWHVKKGGGRFWADGLVMPLKDGADQTRGFLKILRDMTGPRQMEEALREHAAALEAADAHKNEFLAMLAHELRNPLSAISGAMYMLRKPGVDPEELEWSRDVVERQVRHLSRLIDDLLDVSRITQGKIRLRRENFDAAPVITSAVNVVRPLIEDREHELSLVLTPGLRLDADPTRVEQILVNLLTNAAKYTGSGGHISLSARREGGEVVFRVKDTGMGLSAEALPRMFELFAQGDRTLARSEGGLGIGLTLVKNLVEMHGGTVSAASEGIDRGSEFVVRLPAADAPPPAATNPTAPGPAEPRAASRVLVVDDNKDTARAMARLLKRIGHDVRTVHDGMAAVEVARAYRPDVVLLDIGLPGMDGYEVATKLRQGESAREVLIIAISGYGSEPSRHLSAAAGFDHHLIKPVDYDALISLLNRPRAASRPHPHGSLGGLMDKRPDVPDGDQGN